MVEIIDVAASPYDEHCAQVGSPDYAARTRAECNAFIGQLKREIGEPPAGATLFVRSNAHDMGTYYEVAVRVDVVDPAGSEQAIEYAYRCEGAAPAHWDEQALAELASAGFAVRGTFQAL